MQQRRPNDAVHFFVQEITSRIVAASGIPSDRFHLGKIILQSLKDDPELLAQIDGSSDQIENNESVLSRSISCANAFRSFGLKKGDVIILMAPNHLDLCIPYYAALYLGIIIAPVDKTFTIKELEDTFTRDNPKIVFCQSERASDVLSALKSSKTDEALVVTFDKTQQSTVENFADFLEKHGGSDGEFIPEDFDPENTIALIIPTSGTTGLPKQAAATHKNMAVTGPYLWSKYTTFPKPTKMALIVSPLQWLSAIFHFNLSPILKYTRLQSALPSSQKHLYYLINNYKPTFFINSASLMSTLMKPGDRDECDFTCFETIYLSGSAVSPQLIQDINEVTPKTEVCNAYGLTELTAYAFIPHSEHPKSSGKPVGHVQLKLIDVETQEEISEPNKKGELWLKGPGVFKGYYNDAAATKEAFSKDGWLKTGDLFYRDEEWNFFFVERIKLLLKYMNHQISPAELEAVIMSHPGVLEAGVAGVPDAALGELPAACVVLRPGYTLTQHDIINLVKEKCADSKQLRGGVIFLKSLPLTSTTKLDRRKLKEIVLSKHREMGQFQY